MPGLIPQSFIDDLLGRVDIVDVIDAYVPLKKKGKDYLACCPFHQEKTPSFSVSADKQFYYCFGCGAHGTALGFLMDYARLEFPEAVEELAQRVGLEVPREGGPGPADEGRAGLLELMQHAAEFYRRQLREHPAAPRAVEYLKGRGLSGAIAAEFGLGFAPPGWDALLKALGTDEEARARLTRAGLLAERVAGRIYVRFRDRVMFPIQDRRGRVIGFGGRVIGDGEPKYLNSPETPLFHKGRELYGLHRILQARRRPERVLVVEGYMDVLALAQHGVDNAVATLGTATTRDHLERLYANVPEVVFCFDGDKAGRTAAWRALETALPVLLDGRSAGFMFLPEGEDPDTLVRGEGAEGFAARVSNATPLSEFLFDALRARTDTATVEGRARLKELASPLLEKLPRGALRALLVRRLAELTGLPAAELTKLLPGGQPTARPARARAALPERQLKPVGRAIRALLNRPELAARGPAPETVRAAPVAGAPILAEMLEVLQANPHLNPSALIERFRADAAYPHILRLAAAEVPVPEQLAEEFDAALAALRDEPSRQRREQRLAELQAKPLRELSEEEKREFRELLHDARSE